MGCIFQSIRKLPPLKEMITIWSSTSSNKRKAELVSGFFSQPLLLENTSVLFLGRHVGHFFDTFLSIQHIGLDFSQLIETYFSLIHTITEILYTIFFCINIQYKKKKKKWNTHKFIWYFLLTLIQTFYNTKNWCSFI